VLHALHIVEHTIHQTSQAWWNSPI
jgi:hypothetical protein